MKEGRKGRKGRSSSVAVVDGHERERQPASGRRTKRQTRVFSPFIIRVAHHIDWREMTERQREKERGVLPCMHVGGRGWGWPIDGVDDSARTHSESLDENESQNSTQNEKDPWRLNANNDNQKEEERDDRSRSFPLPLPLPLLTLPRRTHTHVHVGAASASPTAVVAFKRHRPPGENLARAAASPQIESVAQRDAPAGASRGIMTRDRRPGAAAATRHGTVSSMPLQGRGGGWGIGIGAGGNGGPWGCSKDRSVACLSTSDDAYGWPLA